LVNPVSAEQLEKEALSLLASFQPEALTKPQAVNVEKFLEGRVTKLAGITTDYRKLSEGIMGWTCSESMQVVISIDLIETSITSERRRGRATIVHECDHALRHIPQFRKRHNVLKSIHDSNHGTIGGMRLYRQSDIPSYLNPEWQSWRWGRSFIMPLPAISELFKKGTSELEMAEIFDVNLKFLQVRMQDVRKLLKI
jgi:hypothetical protein